MAIKRKAGGRITGLAADPKPTAAAEPLNTIFQETDTHDEYINNGSIWMLYRSPSKIETLTNKTIDYDPNTVKALYPSYVMHKVGSTWKAKNMKTGLNNATTSTTDASLVFNAAIADCGGGLIWVTRGTYTCLTQINMTGAAAGAHGIQIRGESRYATILNFAPASALTTGIYFQMSSPVLSDMKISANSNVTNIIRLDGNGQYGLVDNCDIQGAAAAPPTTGQIGISNSPTTANATYYWKYMNSQFNQLDIGIKLDNAVRPANANMFLNLNFINTETGIDVSSNSHVFVNLFFQGQVTVGLVGVRLRPAAFGCQIHNISADLLVKTGGGVVILDAGTSENTISGIYNSSASQPRVRNDSGNANNQIGVYRTSKSTQSGNGTLKIFNISHGYGSANPPAGAILVTPLSVDAKGEFYVSVSAANIVITYTTAPLSGTNNLTWAWRAEVA